MINAYVILYQYFDVEEIKIMNRIQTIQERVLYHDGRSFSKEESQELLLFENKA